MPPVLLYNLALADGAHRAPSGASVWQTIIAKVAELVDAQDSESCDRKVVGVRVPPFAPVRLPSSPPR